MKQEEQYRIYEDGRHYDRMFPRGDDVNKFWVEEAESAGGRVLELACGTGAISIPLARAGSDVTGIDLSPAMLAEARAKSQAEGLAVRWVEGDMRSFDLGERFALVILAANTICHLLDLGSLEACLECVRRHLEPEGRFIVSVFVPDPALLQRRCDVPEPFAEYCDPDGAGTVVVTHTYEYEPDTQIKRITTHHEIPGRSPERGRLHMRMYFPQELDALLRYNGLRIVHKWGDEERSRFGPDSKQQVVVCDQSGRMGS